MHRHRQPQVGRNGSKHADEGLRHHADDGERVAVDEERAAHGIRVAAEDALPGAVAEDGDRRGARRAPLMRQECPAALRGDAEDVEVVAGDEVGQQRTGRVVAETRADSPVAKRGDPIERRRRLGVREQVEQGRAREAAAEHADERGWLAHRRWTQQDAIGDADHGGHHAGPDPQHEQRHQRKTALALEQAQREAEILKQGGKQRATRGHGGYYARRGQLVDVPRTPVLPGTIRADAIGTSAGGASGRAAGTLPNIQVY